jgi:hypothetical protein
MGASEPVFPWFWLVNAVTADRHPRNGGPAASRSSFGGYDAQAWGMKGKDV